MMNIKQVEKGSLNYVYFVLVYVLDHLFFS